ncbi:MATE family efflux transporter [Vallitalea okinawensis]|uniref:MATE family efflux transporter n=1 Tax=Vallitalea okinawensis TaxID=2078660 RepID=UPI000CFABB88|nr:MATE family efflux transporter [Vallitalea okinawensis]
MSNTTKLGQESITKLLLQFSIPAVIANMVNAIYNIVDRIFIGNYAGENALAGLTIAFPLMILIFAFASLVGIGGAALISIKLGENDNRKANHIFGNTLSIAVILGLSITVIGYLSMEGLLRLLGADLVTLPYALNYMNIILGGIIFQLISFALASAARTEGRPKLSMLAMMTSALTNIALDYIFIRIMGWGVKGAALGTIIGQFVGLMLLVGYYVKGKSVLKIIKKDLVPEIKVVKAIVSIGASSFITPIGSSIAMMLLNVSLVNYGGNAAITAMGGINSLYSMFIMPVMGIQQGMQPIIGYNHGANLKNRVKKTLIVGVSMAVAFSSVVFILLEGFPTLFMQLFIAPESLTMPIATKGLRLFILMLPLLSINLLGTAYFQSIAQVKKALFLGAARQFIFLIPVVLSLPKVLGLTGVWLSTPIADGLAVLVTIVMLLPVFKAREKEPKVLLAND